MRISEIRAQDIESMTMPARRDLVRQAHRELRKYLPGCTPFAAIESTLEFFDAQGWGQPGTWISVVDSYVLEALVHGTSMALYGKRTDSVNPGAMEWERYLKQLLAEPTWRARDRAGHDLAWSRAEHVATEYGRGRADTAQAVRDEVQFRWYLLSSMYRSWMIAPPRPWLIRVTGLPLFSWFTDVTLPNPVRHGAHLAHGIAQLSSAKIASALGRTAMAWISDQLRPHRYGARTDTTPMTGFRRIRSSSSAVRGSTRNSPS